MGKKNAAEKSQLWIETVRYNRLTDEFAASAVTLTSAAVVLSLSFSESPYRVLTAFQLNQISD
jgi:hypothetical protein